ncbi:MAG: hypothetical protein KF738_17220 [Burkholderiales bacterium]|nr:hypothetical protein [Burkholderiales bacterium]
MDGTRFGAAAFAFALAGCACVSPDRASVAPADKFNPEVRMVAGVPEAPEVLRFGRGEKGRITWHLKDKGYRFAAADGIRFEARAAGEIVDCRRERNEAKFSCENRHAKDGQGLFYKYDINVEDERGARFTKDPFVLND